MEIVISCSPNEDCSRMWMWYMVSLADWRNRQNSFNMENLTSNNINKRWTHQLPGHKMLLTRPWKKKQNRKIVLVSVKRQAVNYMNENGEQGQRRRHGKFLSYEMKVSEHESCWVSELWAELLVELLMVASMQALFHTDDFWRKLTDIQESSTTKVCVSLLWTSIIWFVSTLLISFPLCNTWVQSSTNHGTDADLCVCVCRGKWFSAWAAVTAMDGVNGKLCVWFWHTDTCWERFHRVSGDGKNCRGN